MVLTVAICSSVISDSSSSVYFFDISDLSDVAVGLDLQSRPVEYKNFQSATAIYRIDMVPKAI